MDSNIKDEKIISLRENVLEFARERFGTYPDYPWEDLPNSMVLRHHDSRKWYGLIMRISSDKLGIKSDKFIDILNVKCGSILSGLETARQGVFPAYHMQKGDWITILLDGTVEKELIFSLLAISFENTKKSSKYRKCK